MFLENKKGKGTSDSPSQQNRIAQGTTIIGHLVSNGGLRVDGKIEGTIKASEKVVVGKTGVINGGIEGTNADFEGRFSGKLKLSGVLSLKPSAYVEGEVEVGKLVVEPGATFNVTCVMKGVVKELNHDEQQRPKSEKEQSA